MVRDKDGGNAREEYWEKTREIMDEYARLTGLEGNGSIRHRYLWTDAFAVCNYLELFCRTGEEKYLGLALSLVDQVHHILGRHRGDDQRKGWISGLDEVEGELHPTAGGLRIGKGLNERQPKESIDESLEWDRDGQYYHYLTKWMHALRCVSRVTGDPVYWRWAVELAKMAHSRFTYGEKRMYWKMNIDLSRPIVTSMGQHDPLDGYITYCELQAAGEDQQNSQSFILKEEISKMARICRGISLPTSDPLGIGGLLFDGSRIAQLMMKGFIKKGDLLEAVLGSAKISLLAYASRGDLSWPAEHRLAFRELGLSIGLGAVEEMARWREERLDLFALEELNIHMDALLGLLPLRGAIEKFWLNERNRQASTWRDHQEINMVMLACSLAPSELLLI